MKTQPHDYIVGNNLDDYELAECATCSAKLGSPTLCAACYKNRTMIDRLKKEIKLIRHNNQSVMVVTFLVVGFVFIMGLGIGDSLR